MPIRVPSLLGAKVIDRILVPIHRAGWPFIAIFAVITLFFFTLATPLGWLGVLLTVWCVYFFRDPARVTPQRKGLIISPADGVVQRIQKVPPPPELGIGDAPMTRVSVFMNVFNVHVNRAPVEGELVRTAYHEGKFFNASLDKASIHNERLSLLMRTDDGVEIAFVQIAGLVARRIVRLAQDGVRLKAGERFGLIRFGSRVDVYLPEGVEPLVCEGQVTLAGETVLADLAGTEPARLGEVR
ncbi:phosphatidylserine decarboxylase [Radicibacter daui]|uniref:phosphatidylserine decarboxylase n=1 Tax=Radicibacter daui TaxID=3064829 RepID=UPI004046B52E